MLVLLQRSSRGFAHLEQRTGDQVYREKIDLEPAP